MENEVSDSDYLTWEPYGKLDKPSYKRRVWKNIILISLVFLLNFLSFMGLSNLQSSLHVDEGIGVISQSILYVSLVIASLFLPKLTIYWVGHKWSITLSLIGYILWMAANGHGEWSTMVPASIICGVSGAPLWTAQSVYFTELGQKYAFITSQKQSTVITLFFGVFFMFFQAFYFYMPHVFIANIFASIISTTVLKQSPPENYTEPDVEYCGVDDCPSNNMNNTYLEKPEEKLVWTLCGIYIIIAIAGFIISAVFVDNLPTSLQLKADPDKTIMQETWELLGSTMKQIGDPKQALLIPLTLYTGFEQTFRMAEFSKSWITCSLGIWMVGLINLPFAFADAIVSITGGSLVKYTGRITLFVSALVIDSCIQVTLATWTVSPEQVGVYYTVSTLWGISDGIWQTQLNALYGIIFVDSSEAAFANFRMWQSVGFLTAFAYSYFLCTSVKLYILFSFLYCGSLCYFYVEWIYRNNTKQLDIQIKMESL